MLTRKWIASPNYSSRSESGVRLIVLHTAEGALTIESLGNYFASASAGVSSHTGADDKKNTVGEYVKRANKAWTQGNANSVAVSIELCAFAKWSTTEWHKHPNMLENCAKWIAEEAAHFGIPIVGLSSSQAQGSGRGVCQHADLGSMGGGHWDCGGGFPMAEVLEMAKGGEGSGAEESKTTWYFIQDVVACRQAGGQRMFYGGWSSKESRDNQIETLTERFDHPFRAFNDNDFPSEYFIDNSAYVKEIYGGWTSKQGRDDQLNTLESRLGRTLRPFSESRTKAQGGVAWGCVNLEDP